MPGVGVSGLFDISTFANPNALALLTGGIGGAGEIGMRGDKSGIGVTSGMPRPSPCSVLEYADTGMERVDSKLCFGVRWLGTWSKLWRGGVGWSDIGHPVSFSACISANLALLSYKLAHPSFGDSARKLQTFAWPQPNHAHSQPPSF